MTFKIRYIKLSVFIFSLILAYMLLRYNSVAPVHDTLILLGYFGTFLAGLLYAYGFTAPAATVILLILAKEQNTVLAGLIAGVGALFSDLVIFRLTRYCFADEMGMLSKEKLLGLVSRKLPSTIRKHLLLAIACFLIASPLPTEIGIMLLASVKKMSTKKFAAIAYILHTIGIFTILVIGKII